MSQAGCGIARALRAIGDWWSLLIVRDAFRGIDRFDRFQSNLGIARNILAARLKKLVELGILTIEPDPAARRTHRYVLTSKGEDLAITLIALWQWGEANCFAPGEAVYEMVDRTTGEPLPRLMLRARDGRALGPREFHMRAIKDTED